jgi:hypothetical protein
MVGDARRAERYGSPNRLIIDEWQEKWSSIYKTSDKYYMVFNSEEIDILFGVMKYSIIRHDEYRTRRSDSEKAKIISKFREFISIYGED